MMEGRSLWKGEGSGSDWNQRELWDPVGPGSEGPGIPGLPSVQETICDSKVRAAVVSCMKAGGGDPGSSSGGVVAHHSWVSGPVVAWWSQAGPGLAGVAAAAWWVASRRRHGTSAGAWRWGQQGLGVSGVGPGAADHHVNRDLWWSLTRSRCPDSSL